MAINNKYVPIDNQPTISPRTVTGIFTRYIAKTLPLAFDESMSYYECLCALLEYLNETIVPDINNTNEGLSELQTFYLQLQSYVNNYFDNLDVQQEINNKLDEMTASGELTEIIKDYVDPIQDEFEEEIMSTVNAQNELLSTINNKVDSAVSGAPLIANSMEDMTDTTRIYVLTTNGHWYWYDTDTWTDGGVYQATVENYDTTLTQNNTIPNSKSVGDKVNPNIIAKNLFDKNDVINNYYYGADGTLVENNEFIITNIIEVKNGERIVSIYNIHSDNDIHYPANMFQIVKVTALGEFISRNNQYSQAHWVADEDCFIRITYRKTESLPDYLTNLIVSKFIPVMTYKPHYYELKEDNSEIDQISEYVNLFDIDNSALSNTSLNTNGVLTNTNHYFVPNIMECVTGDTFYLKYHNPNVTDIKFGNVMKYDTNLNLIERVNVNNTSYTATHNGYVIFSCVNPNDSDLHYLTISKNIQLGEYVPHKRSIINDSNNEVNIKKVDDSNFIITFGNFKIKLFKTVDASINANNWNLKTLTDYADNILVPEGTDIIGPVKINENTDFIGGVHGDETTTEIRVVIGSHTYNINEITDLSANSITITMKSTCYDQIAGDKAFDRYVTLYFTKNKIHVINSFKAAKDLYMRRATNGGLIGCRNNIINSIMFNNSFFGVPPTSAVNNQSRYNTSATINTIYGSITVNNIKGYDYENYEGQLTVMTSENPMRCKVYFSTYKNGNYPISSGDIISGEFEYLLS